jgi:hypothetical protein
MLEGSTVIARTRRLRQVRVGSLVAVALAAAFGAWLLVRALDNGSGSAPVETAKAQIVSVQRLHAVAAAAGYPVYWAAARRGFRYELTQLGTRTYVRYLPANVAPGDPRADFLAIGTYRDPKAFAQTRTAGARPGAVTIPLGGGGGIAVYSREHPTSVYFSYRHSGVQVEVYHPNARIARSLVLTHRVLPVNG